MSANVSDDGRYRYYLERAWDDSLAQVFFVMLNPSTADAAQDDPTIRRCVGFARRWGFGSVGVVNLFAFRATDPVELQRTLDPVGPENDHWLEAVGRRVEASVIVAWGSWGQRYPWRVKRAVELMHRATRCLGVTKSGDPKHPLYVRGDSCPMPWPALHEAPTTAPAAPASGAR